MDEQLPKRFVFHGLWLGAVLGVALSLLLRRILGPPDHYVAKTVAIVVLIAGFSAFVGVLVDASRRKR